MGYVEAMLGFETERITVALARLSDAQALAHSFAKRAKHGKDHAYVSKKMFGNSSDIDMNGLEVGQDSEICFSRRSSISSANSTQSAAAKPKIEHAGDEEKSRSRSTGTATEIDYELLEANCMLMSATIQFLRDNWIDYMKAAYKLRKAYRMYEHMFEIITGITTEKYAARLRKDLKTQHHSRLGQTGPAAHRNDLVPGIEVDVVGRSLHSQSISPSLTATLLSASSPPSPLPTDHNSVSISPLDTEPLTLNTAGADLPATKPSPSFTALLANTQFEAPTDKKRYSLWMTRSPFDELANDQAISSVPNIQQSPNESIKAPKHRKCTSLPLFGDSPTKELASDMMWPSKKPSINSTDVPIATVEAALESGVFFGVGLFALIFSLLPPKGN